MIPEAVLFDFGGTLVTPPPLDAAAGAAAVLAVARAGHDVTVERYLEEGVRVIPVAEARRRTAAAEIELPTACFQRLLHGRLGLRFDGPSLAQEHAWWDGAYGSMPAEPGIARFLDALAARHIPTAVVSNTTFRGETLERELVRAGLRDRLGPVLSSADHALRKPHPAMLETALASLEVAPSRAWFCGDRADRDVACARAAGALAVLYAPDGGEPAEPRADLVLRHWDEATDRIRAGDPR